MGGYLGKIETHLLKQVMESNNNNQTHVPENKLSRWINANTKATKVILEGDTTFFHWDFERNSLLFRSTDSN